MAAMLAERVRRFIADPAADDFDRLALEVATFQHAHIPEVRRLWQRRGLLPDAARSWRDVPPVPTLAFKSLELHAAEAREVFRSSGTRGGGRSSHFQPWPQLYRAAVDASFPRFCLPRLHLPPMLALVPDRQQAPDSSLSFMVDHVLRRFAGEGSAHAFGSRGVDVPAARSWLAARQREKRPVVVLATSFALAQLLDALERRTLRFRMSPGSVLFDTGGFKGRTTALEPADLTARVGATLGIPAEQVVREYGMSELSSQAYTATLLGGDRELFVPPHWLGVRVLSADTLADLPAGEEGLLAFFDLANAGSVAAVLTEDLGRLGEGGFRLRGRAADAELRGCSLTVEELRLE
ncbi:MAG TPA: hypothetical protein VMT16_13975 [Thermoanaerobaculia bacterium]|nr:hypothetical protein [Thermoanaerobaculia bacterium]